MGRRNRGSKYSLRGVRWQMVRLRMMERAGWRCERCKRPSRLEVHHRKPLEHGGAPYDPKNLEVLCRRCHIEHHQALADSDNPPGRRKWRRIRDAMRDVR